ncbi:putative metalloprotease [Alternaria alternata]|nr:putative metalloprotease [Alternaria alternata]
MAFTTSRYLMSPMTSCFSGGGTGAVEHVSRGGSWQKWPARCLGCWLEVRTQVLPPRKLGRASWRLLWAAARDYVIPTSKLDVPPSTVRHLHEYHHEFSAGTGHACESIMARLLKAGS